LAHEAGIMKNSIPAWIFVIGSLLAIDHVMDKWSVDKAHGKIMAQLKAQHSIACLTVFLNVPIQEPNLLEIEPLNYEKGIRQELAKLCRKVSNLASTINYGPKVP